MSLLLLLKQNFRHVLRTRVLFVLLLFCFVIQYVGVRGLHSVTIHFQGVVSTIDTKDALFIALLFQLFTGAFLAAVYGIWMMPYAHQGSRSYLTFTLPVSKWTFPLGYGLTMLLLLLMQTAILLASYGMNYGFAQFQAPGFPWRGFCLAIGLQILAFEVLTFAYAVCSMIMGQIPTFFMGFLVLFLLQVGGMLFRFNVGHVIGKDSSSFQQAYWLYQKLPPVGELVLDLRKVFFKMAGESVRVELWVAWLVLFVVLFRVKLSFPATSRGPET